MLSREVSKEDGRKKDRRGEGGEDIRTEADKQRKGEENFVGGGGEILLWRGKRGRRLSGRAQTLGWLPLPLVMEG